MAAALRAAACHRTSTARTSGPRGENSDLGTRTPQKNSTGPGVALFFPVAGGGGGGWGIFWGLQEFPALFAVFSSGGGGWDFLGTPWGGLGFSGGNQRAQDLNEQVGKVGTLIQTSLLEDLGKHVNLQRV